MSNYLEINRANWDERAPAHAESPDYGVARFIADPKFLSDVVTFDLPLLGDIRGLRGVHLQCHIGTDTISLARLGADMTGLDFSPASIAQALRLSELAKTPVKFVESNVYNALNVLDPVGYDFVFTGIGAICWLPEIKPWAKIVAGLLKPGGRLFIREGHPMLWAINEAFTEHPVVGFPYFETPEPLIMEEGGTYVETDQAFTHNVGHTWNHGLGELISALMSEGMKITGLAEHDSVPWEALPGQMTKGPLGEWRLTDRPRRLAASYTLQAVKQHR